jgi:hypothetical protein
LSYIIIKEPARQAKIDVIIINDTPDLKAWLADDSLKEGQLVADIRCWRKVVRDGTKLILEAIPIKEITSNGP